MLVGAGEILSFVHLHLHSQYSLLESSIDFDGLLDACVADQAKAVAVTDLGNLFGAMEFYLAAKKKGVKPILGCEVFIAPQGRLVKSLARDESGNQGAGPQFPRLVLLAKNENGYRNLVRLVSLGFTEGFYYKPRVDYEILQKYSQDLIALSSSKLGEVASKFYTHGPEGALERIEFYKNIFGENFYLEIQRQGLPEQEKLNEFLIKTSKAKGIPLVATNEPHYLAQEDSFSQEVMLCIQGGKTLLDDKRPRLPNDQFFLKSQAEMEKLFGDIPEAIANSVKIADQCNVEFKLTDEKGQTIYHLPQFPVEAGQTIADKIRQMAEEGLRKRFDEAKLRNEEIKDEKVYYDRLAYELSVIGRMGFEGYFLIVADFIGFAKNNGIPVGPGRGSGAGSLVAYSLRITDLDPLQYNLLFERFLNPERISMPDFDVDFCQDRRGEVINYVTAKYGSECVAQIITFGKLQARAAIRDVGRAMGMAYGEVDFIAKLIPEKIGITLDEAIKTEPQLSELMENDPKISSLLRTALKLEGLTRHASIHAAGVIISSKPLVEYCPLYKGNEGEIVIQFDMIVAEKIGLVKFDFLGLKTLTMIDNAIKMVHKNKKGFEDLSTVKISLSDPKIYELLSQGNTAGVFQFEGEGISDLIRKVKPTKFEEITAINALYRPGPMNMLEEYVQRKQGKIDVTYLFPQLEDILKETYGIIVYQEQVQMIAARVANYSLGEADILRRAMGKKKPEEMAKQKERFMRGAAENKLDAKKSSELFDLMAKFAEYGFNKSHAAAYCVVAAQTAYMKAYHPVEFYASLISTEMSDTDKLVKYIRDAAQHNVKVLSPDVNTSEFKFEAKGEEIVYGLGGIKGVGEAAVQAILEAREKKPGNRFEDLLDFFESVDLRRVNKKVIECLIKAGAFDKLHPVRAALADGVAGFLEAAESAKRDKEVGQGNLFAMDTTTTHSKIEIPKREEWSRSVKLQNEKDVLGFYLSDHPLAGMENILGKYVTCKMGDLSLQPPKKSVTIGGIVGNLKEIITKKGARMGFAQLEDQTAHVELVIFSDAYAKSQHLLRSGRPVIVTGQLEREQDVNKILVESVQTVESLSSKAREIVIKLHHETGRDSVRKLKDILSRNKGGLPSRLEIHFSHLKQTVEMELGPNYSVTPSENLFEELQSHLGTQGSLKLN